MSELVVNIQPKHPEGVKYSPLAFAIASLLIILVLYQLLGGGISLIIAGGNITDDNVMLSRTVMMGAQFLLLLLPTLWLVRRQHGQLSRALRWRVPGVSEVILSILGMVALLQAAEGYIYFQDKIPIPEKIAPYVEMMKKLIEETYQILLQAQSVPELLFVIAVASLTPAICEEILFRGLVQKNITLATNSVRGFVITGIIFGLYHFNPFLAVPLVILGVYFSFLQYRSQTLIIPMIAHFVNNTVSTVAAYVYGFDQSDMPSLLTQGDGETSSFAVLATAIIFVIIFIVIVRMYIRVTEHLEQDAQALGGGNT